MTEFEERLAHLIRAVDDLSEVVARQDREIDRLKAHMAWLARREQDREGEGEGGIVLGEERPPHY